MASVIVTGTSSGLGLETALTLGRRGHTVFATMRNPARSPELAGKVAEEKLPIHISVIDVDSDESVKRGMAQIFAQAGHIDALVNNAGVAREGSTEDMPLSVFRAVMETNYFGALRCIQAVVPQMRERRSGCIVNISSISGRISTTPFGAYSASKYALEAMSEALAQEMKQFGVRVAIVEPGIIDTPLARSLEEVDHDGPYSHQSRRFTRLFVTSLQDPAKPSLVANKVAEIIEGESWQLRYPVGSSAAGTIAWRNSMSDEEYVDLNAADDDTWYTTMEALAGKRMRPGS
jgi:NAD(P)-dependent dehydrogenase (short-subunit alcohol dehydrogenase family)